MKTTFGKLVDGAVFMYGSRKMYKKGSEKAADYGTSGKSERFSANVEVEIENAVETVPFSDRATPAQISYMKSLGIAVTYEPENAEKIATLYNSVDSLIPTLEFLLTALLTEVNAETGKQYMAQIYIAERMLDTLKEIKGEENG